MRAINDAAHSSWGGEMNYISCLGVGGTVAWCIFDWPANPWIMKIDFVCDQMITTRSALLLAARITALFGRLKTDFMVSSCNKQDSGYFPFRPKYIDDADHRFVQACDLAL